MTDAKIEPKTRVLSEQEMRRYEAREREWAKRFAYLDDFWRLPHQERVRQLKEN